jgi:hypothetical protein
MQRTTLNRLVDTLAFVGFVLVATTGVVLRYLLPPGSGRPQGRGIGHQAAERAVTRLWGLTRHAWGEVHVWIACGLMIVLAIHLMLHWRWIVCAVRDRPRQGSGVRAACGVMGLGILLAIAVALLLSPTDRVPRGQLTGPVPPRRLCPRQTLRHILGMAP